MGERRFASHTKRFQLVVAFADYLGRAHAAQNLHAGRQADLLVGALNGRERHLSQCGSVEALRRILAHVAVAAVVLGLFAEIIQQYPSPADGRFGILLHAFEFVHVDVLLSALSCKLRELYHIGQRIEQDGLGRSPVATGTPNLLVETLNALGHVVVNHPAHVLLVDAHTEGYRGANHLHEVLFEHFLGVVALAGGQRSMVGQGLDAQPAQVGGQFLGALAAQAVDDACLVGACLDEVGNELQLLGRLVAALHAQTQVRAVETRHKLARMCNIKVYKNVSPSDAVGGGR